MVDNREYYSFFTKELDMFEDAKNAVLASLDITDKSKAFNFMNFSLANPFDTPEIKHPQLPQHQQLQQHLQLQHQQPSPQPSPPPQQQPTTQSPSECSNSNNSKSSKEIVLDSLQDEQNNLIEQRIQDRTINLRNTVWPTCSNNRSLFNLDIGGNGSGQPFTSELSPAFTNTISSSCMATPNRNMNWFNRSPSVASDGWSNEFCQDPTMRSRPCFSSQQTRELEREFSVCQYVTRRQRIELAYSLSLTEKQIKTWFQNRRVKERKQKKMSSSGGDLTTNEAANSNIMNQAVI